MTYDYKEIAKRVSKRRKHFVACLGVVIALMIAALVLIILNLNDVTTFLSIVAELILSFVLYGIFDKHSPKVIFSKEITGINVKEDEYITRKTYGPGLSYRQIGGHAPPMPYAPNTGANKRRTPPSLRGKVYLELENGDIVILSGLYKAHTDIFVEGDTLFKPAGAKYPIVIGRSVSAQPCPLCGEVNDFASSCCKSCGLAIIHD